MILRVVMFTVPVPHFLIWKTQERKFPDYPTPFLVLGRSGKNPAKSITSAFLRELHPLETVFTSIMVLQMNASHALQLA